ncbi:MAG TPA: N-acetyltransferase [Candidatus Kryptonia bacterium]|nr:N-acetyltransferase [Candidatus Kryptonia bacterium]
MSAADTLAIRAERPQDRAAISEVNVRAFGRADEARLVDELRGSRAFIPDLSLVAECDGRVVGHVLFSRIVIQTGGGDVPALALAPVAVEPELHKQGIGAALIGCGLERARELGHRIVIVLGHATYYPRFGFAPASRRGITAPFPVRDESFMYCDLVTDASVGVRGTVQYPPPFGAV